MLRIAGLAATLLFALCGNAAAQPRTVSTKPPMRVKVCGGGGEVEIKLHRDLIIKLDSPMPIGSIWAVDNDRFVFWVRDTSLRIRPHPSKSKPGQQTMAELKLGDQWVMLRLRVVSNPDDVELHWQLFGDKELCAKPVRVGLPPLVTGFCNRCESCGHRS